jgi:regulator of replication initiation timing
VTEPDPVADLAAQLEELRGQLARYQGEVGQLRSRFSEDYGQVLMLRLEVKKLGEKLDEAIGRRQAEDPQAPFWLGLSKGEHADQLAELRAWVERVALVQYPAYFGKLPPCWARHAELVLEISDVMTEWVRIYGDPDNRPLQDALWFHERWLPGVLARCEKWFRCDVAGCRLDGHPLLQRPPQPYA